MHAPLVPAAHLVPVSEISQPRLTVPATRKRILASLVNVSADMAARLAAGLGRIVLGGIGSVGASVAAFIAALGKHRHPEREADPPRIRGHHS